MTTVAVGLEYPLHPGEHRLAQLREVGAAMVDRRSIDRAQHAVRDVGRPRDLQEMTAGGESRLAGSSRIGTSEACDGAAGRQHEHPWAGELPARCSTHNRDHDRLCAARLSPRDCARRRRRAVRRRVARHATRPTRRSTGRAGRRARPEVAGRRARGDRRLSRGEGADAAARRGQLAVRADGRRGARHRSQQAPERDRSPSIATR